MKNKSTLFIIFVFAFAGFVLLGSQPSWAWDHWCTPTEEDSGQCVVFYDGDFPAYVMKIAPENGQWPIPAENGMWKFRYFFGQHDGSKVSAPSYIGLKLRGDYQYIEPQGALLEMTQLYSDCGETVQEPWYVVKLNVKKEDIVEIGSSSREIDFKCSWAMAKFSSICSHGPLALPKMDDYGPAQETTEYTCPGESGVTVTITPSECGDDDPTIICTGGPYVGEVSAVPHADTLIRTTVNVPSHEDFPKTKEFPPQAFGIQPGCVVCTDTLPVVLIGNEAWWCPDLTLP